MAQVSGYQLQPLVPLVDEFAARLFGELDYVAEGHSCEKFARLYRDVPRVRGGGAWCGWAGRVWLGGWAGGVGGAGYLGVMWLGGWGGQGKTAQQGWCGRVGGWVGGRAAECQGGVGGWVAGHLHRGPIPPRPAPPTRPARPQVRCPGIQWDYTSRRVLTMEWIEGVKLTDQAGARAHGCACMGVKAGVGGCGCRSGV